MWPRAQQIWFFPQHRPEHAYDEEQGRAPRRPRNGRARAPLDRALVRLNLLIGSDDDRVALRAVKEVLDRVLGRPRQQQEYGRSFERRRGMETELVQAREKLAPLIARHAAAV